MIKLSHFTIYNDSQLQQLTKMKGKQNRKHKNSQNVPRDLFQRSASFDRSQKKSQLNSVIYESSRNSLCSPRENKSQINKFDSYMQYLTSGKFPQDSTNQNHKQQSYTNRPRTSTPTPRRLSACIIQQGRRSVQAKENPSREQIKNQRYSKGVKTPRDKNKALFVKGHNIVKTNVSGEQARKKINQDRTQPLSTKRKSTIKIDEKKQSKGEDKVEERQRKLIEKLFAGIQFHRELGRGAHAIVRSGVDINKQRKIAVKIYQKRDLSSENMKSIEREVEILGCLDHPSIIKLYQIIETIKTINLVMEYGGGNTLQQYIRNRAAGKLDENQTRNIFRHVIVTVAYLHQKGIAHRDLKTDNVLLNKYLQVKLIDFGFSQKQVGQQLSTTYCGTPTYMAPEIVMRKPHYPIQADLWSLGILLYNMLHGHCPFKASNQKQLFKKICERQIQFQPHISNEAQNLILNLLAIEPEHRLSAQMVLNHSWMKQK